MCTRIRKGIINPNYPGFQSLAYTLNDDQFDYSSENPSDDEEDSYVSESDDNEMKRRDPSDDVGDENGNSYAGNGGGMQQEDELAGGRELQLHSSAEVPVVSTGMETLGSTLYHQAKTIGSEKVFGSSPARRSRMRFIPNGCRSPSLTTMIEAVDKLESTGIYACTPPDIVLQHGFEHRTTVFGSGNEQLQASLELSNSRRPDLIPEAQLQQEKKKNEFNKQQFILRPTEEQPSNHPTEYDELKLDEDVVDEEENEKEEEQDMEGNRTPPSPAMELAISISNSDSSSHFLRNVTISPDPLLDDATQGSVSDDTLSDDSDHSDPESDEAEFGYQPYDGADMADISHTPDAAGTPESPGNSAGSSPGELQYHLVDDCSNQTVQITRSRQSSEHSPSNQYHALLQHYSSLGPTDFCNNQTRLAENEINCNDLYPSLKEIAQAEPISSAGDRASVPFDERMIHDGLVSTDYPDGRSQPMDIHRSAKDVCSQKPRHGQHNPTTLPCEEKVTGDTTQESVETAQPVRLYQRVPKVNPFSELLLQENDTCDFFTKQAKLQIEARMALCQAKDMAHMQMEIEKRSLPLSPVTKVIHTAVQKAGVCLSADKRRLSRYYLTRLNVAQLQTILLELQCHAEVLNEELVQLLMDRDDLHISQDATLIDIEDLSRYLCAKEQTIIHAERQRKSYHWNSNRTAHHPTHHQKQPSRQSHPQPQQMRSSGGSQSTVPAYRYH